MEDGDKSREQLLEELQELRQRVEQLAHEQFLLRNLLDNLPDAIYFKNADSRFLKISPGLAKRFGISDPESAVGKTDFDFFTEEHARQAYEDEQKIIQSGEALTNVDEKETWPDGHVTWVSTTKMPLKDEEGNIIGTFGISRDITSHKKLEEEREKLLQDLQDALARIKALRGLLPICASCKRIRDDAGYWHQIESYLHDHSDADFTHCYCPDCEKKALSEIDEDKKKRKRG